MPTRKVSKVKKPKKICEHAAIRMNQRGIHPNDLDLALLHGEPGYAPGGATRYVLSEKLVRKLIRSLNRIRRGLVAIVGPNGDVKTVYKKYK